MSKTRVLYRMGMLRRKMSKLNIRKIVAFISVVFIVFGFVGCGQTGTNNDQGCLLYTSPSPRDQRGSRMPSSA